MAVSCPEVMYGAYYPYLYGRGAARSFHHAPHFQYDRLNVQSAGNAGEYGGSVASGSAGGGAPALSSGSASSGAQSPGSPPHAHALPLPQHVHAHAHAHAHLTHAHSHPSQHHSPRLRTKEEDLSAHGRASADGGGSSESEGECGGVSRARAQYVSANCVVFTHYSGDVAAVVDDHFTRALSLDKPKGLADGVAQSSRVVLQRGSGRARVRRPRVVRLRPLAPALRGLRPRASPRRRVPCCRGAPQYGGRRLRRPTTGPRIAARAIQACGLAACARARRAPRARAPRLAAPRSRRLLALLLPRAPRSGAAGAGHVEGPLLVLTRSTPRYLCSSSTRPHNTLPSCFPLRHRNLSCDNLCL